MQMYLDGLPAGNPRFFSGLISPMLPGSFVTIGGESGRTVCGNCANRFFKGLIDEVDIFDRALSSNEIAAIYSASAGGKCPLPPTFVSQPQSHSVAFGTGINLQAVACGQPPLNYQWLFNGTAVGGATDSLLSFSEVQFADGGTYS